MALPISRSACIGAPGAATARWASRRISSCAAWCSPSRSGALARFAASTSSRILTTLSASRGIAAMFASAPDVAVMRCRTFWSISLEKPCTPSRRAMIRLRLEGGSMSRNSRLASAIRCWISGSSAPNRSRFERMICMARSCHCGVMPALRVAIEPLDSDLGSNTP